MFSFSHWQVKGLSSRRTALKVDVIGPENVLFEGTFLHLSAGNLTGWGSEGVKASLEGRETRAVTESDRTGRQIVACAAD